MMKIKTILLAEDNPQDVELISEVLSEFKKAINVIAVSDGVEALEYLHCEGKFRNRTAGDPDLVLLDIKMPRMDGIEVLESIKKDEKFKFIPAVILTSSREDSDLEKCYALGANAYIVKPVDYKEFKMAVRHIQIFWAVLNELPPRI